MKINIFSKKPKIDKKNFSILKYKEYTKIKKINYNTRQLKKILKFYKQKISGNKGILIERVYLFLYHSSMAIKIQKNIRKYFVYQFFILSGPAVNNYSMCQNQTDFLSLNNLKTINKLNFFSFADKNNYIYGFEFISIYNLFLKSDKIPYNPYNRSLLPKYVLPNINKKISLGKILKIPLNINLKDITDQNTDLFKLRVLGIFQKIDELGNYTNLSWFLNLNKFKLLKFVKELEEIWCYRAALTLEIQKKIIAEPFSFKKYKKDLNIGKSYKFLQKKILNIIEIFVTKGIDKHHQSLGSFYVLGALTLVNSEAALALPWLYESMVYV